MATTWGELKTEIEAEYDLGEETWIAAEELMVSANAAIRSIEKQIHTFHDKYFETETQLSLISGVSVYDLPADIYAAKITGVFYNDGSDKYEIKPIKRLSDTIDVDADEQYQYKVINTTSNGLQIKLYPASRITSSTTVTLFYIRNAKLFSSELDELDIPEAKDFIKQFVVDRAVNKERMTPDAPESAQLQVKRKDLLDSLENMIDDDNNEVGVDYSFYGEFQI